FVVSQGYPRGLVERLSSTVQPGGPFYQQLRLAVAVAYQTPQPAIKMDLPRLRRCLGDLRVRLNTADPGHALQKTCEARTIPQFLPDSHASSEVCPCGFRITL